MSRESDPATAPTPTLVGAVPALPVSDIQRSVAFYDDQLDLAVVYQEDGFAIVRRDDVELHLWAATDEDWRTREGSEPVESDAESFIAGTASCRVRVENVEALHELLEPRGLLHPNGPLRVTEYGTHEFTITDPDNNAIAFFEPL